MTEKPVKPLSERIREAQYELGKAISNHRFDDNPVRVASASLNVHKATLGFLAELAEMMEAMPKMHQNGQCYGPSPSVSDAMLQARKDT